MTTLPAQIRAAAAAGDYARACDLFDEHAGALREERGGRLDEQALAEMFELLEWTRQAALAQRSHLEARIQELRGEAYVNRAYAARPGGGTWPRDG